MSDPWSRVFVDAAARAGANPPDTAWVSTRTAARHGRRPLLHCSISGKIQPDPSEAVPFGVRSRSWMRTARNVRHATKVRAQRHGANPSRRRHPAGHTDRIQRSRAHCDVHIDVAEPGQISGSASEPAGGRSHGPGVARSSVTVDRPIRLAVEARPITPAVTVRRTARAPAAIVPRLRATAGSANQAQTSGAGATTARGLIEVRCGARRLQAGVLANDSDGAFVSQVSRRRSSCVERRGIGAIARQPRTSCQPSSASIAARYTV